MAEPYRQICASMWLWRTGAATIPHVLEQGLSWHARCGAIGSMGPEQGNKAC
ncbi:MAG: hypothetical protein ABWY08_09715 [Comamonas sp.]